LARNSTDWHRLLEICALAEALILDEDGLYDPSHFNDRLLLGLKGTMSEAELHVLRARLLGGQVGAPAGQKPVLSYDGRDAFRADLGRIGAASRSPFPDSLVQLHLWVKRGLWRRVQFACARDRRRLRTFVMEAVREKLERKGQHRR
jgi:hypothetical protein